jgi:hypothetical protein
MLGSRAAMPHDMQHRRPGAAGRAYQPSAQGLDIGVSRQRATIQLRPSLAVAAVNQQHVSIRREVFERVAVNRFHPRILAEAGLGNQIYISIR